MVNGSKTLNPVAIIGVLVAIGALIIVASRMPSRMPPDPFEEDELREVTVEVEWDGVQRGQLIAWDVGDDEGELHTEGVGNDEGSSWRWTHITTARAGTKARVSAIQDSPGPILCAIYVNEQQITADDTSSQHGCFAETTIP